VVNETVTDSTETRRLLARLRAGDAGAFEELFARQRAYLHQVIDMRLDAQIRRRVDASDVIQETQIEAARRMAEYLRRRPMPFYEAGPVKDEVGMGSAFYSGFGPLRGGARRRGPI
jgi:RNA polymerase sigma-70 factor (ECF subfamily)